MSPQEMYKQLNSARLGRLVAAGISAVLLVVIILLSVTLATQTNQVVLIPTSVSDGMVARGATDKRYVEALALDAVYGLYNASPANTEYGRQVLERVSSARDRDRILSLYDEISKDIKARKISTVFYTEEVEHNPSSLEVIVTGRLQTYLNTVLVNTEPRRVLLVFKLEAGSVRLSKISKLETE